MSEFNTGVIDIYMPVNYGEGTSVERYGELKIERRIREQTGYKYNVNYYCTIIKRNSELPNTALPITVKVFNYTDDKETENGSTFESYLKNFWVNAIQDKQAQLNGYGGLYDMRITVESEIFCNADGNKFIAEFTDTFELNSFTSRAVELIAASDFTDEDNPTITILPNTKQGNYVQSVQAVISLNGDENDIVRDLNVNETRNSYTFQLTDTEREKIREAITKGTSKQIAFKIINTPTEAHSNIPVFYSTITRTVSLLDALPVIYPTLSIMDSNTGRLTGDADTFIKYYTYASYSINAEVGKSASIVSQQVVCANQINKAATGILSNVESGVFVFSATDNRGNTVTETIEKPLVEYVKLSCNQKVNIELSGETEATVSLIISGNYFNDTFGAEENELILELRHTQNDGSMGEWVRLTDGLIPVFDGNTYSLDITISGLQHYDMPYTFQCRAIDKISTVETEQYKTRVTPLFDWNEQDFNFNIPVTVQGGKCHGVHILSDTTTDGVVQLNDNISNYEYIEILYTDNNGRGAGVLKFPVSDNTITVDLFLVEASSATTTYIRRTAYICKGTTLTPATTAAGYAFIGGSSVSHTTGTNYLRVKKVLGYR